MKNNNIQASKNKHTLNLLSDTGKAAREFKMKLELRKITIIIILVSAITFGISLVYTRLVDQKINNYQHQISTLKEKIASQTQPIQIAYAYQQRLNQIKKIQLEHQIELPPWKIYEQTNQLLSELDVEVAQFNLTKNKIMLQFKPDSALASKNLLQKLKTDQNKLYWSSVVVDDFTLDPEQGYSLTIKANIKSTDKDQKKTDTTSIVDK